MDEDFFSFDKAEAAIQDGTVAGAAAFGGAFKRWARRYALELEEFFDVGGPNHFDKARRCVAWLGERVFRPGVPPFDPDMAFDDVIETYCQGHAFGNPRDFLSALLHSPAETEVSFPPPWIDAGDIDGYRIEPITTADGLRDEGERMHHCVGSYVPDVARGQAYFYHVSKAGGRVATLQLTRTDSRYDIEEIRGICNADVPGKALAAVKSWVEKTSRV